MNFINNIQSFFSPTTQETTNREKINPPVQVSRDSYEQITDDIDASHKIIKQLMYDSSNKKEPIVPNTQFPETKPAEAKPAETKPAEAEPLIIDPNNFQNPSLFSEDCFSSPLSDEEKKAIKDYTGGPPLAREYFRNINKYLRGLAELEESNKPTLKAITSAFERASIPADMMTYRFASRAMLGNLKSLPPKDLIGKVLQDKAFLSSTSRHENIKQIMNGLIQCNDVKDPGAQIDLQLNISIPKGAKGACISDLSYFHAEGEVLLAPGTKMIITKADKNDDGLLTIDVSVIKDE